MWQDFVNFWNSYSTQIWAFITTFGIGTAVVLLRKYGIQIGQRLLQLFIRVLVKLFGGEVSEDTITNAVNALPFIQDLKMQVEKSKEDDELKLIQIRQKLLSPKLSELERVAYEAQYSLISKKLDGFLSEATKETLEKMENIANKLNI